MLLSLSDNALIILKKRYLHDDETPEQLFRRVAKAVAAAETEKDRNKWEEIFYNLMATLQFLPNSPCLANAGTNKGCLSACFCISPEDTMESIMKTAYDAAMIEKYGGGIGFGFSKLRPEGDKISTTHGVACGPVAVMKLYSKVGDTLTQGAFRLGAHMGQLSILHPDVRKFIHCKDDDKTLQNFNISVQLTDDFMEIVSNKDSDDYWGFINPRTQKVEKTVKVVDLFREICESAWKTGDPGVVFIDRVNATHPNPSLGQIDTSNPCGEQHLENYGNCNLGSIDISKFVEGAAINKDELNIVIYNSIRFLDDVVEINHFPLEKLQEINLLTRRIGLGVMGWADTLALVGIAYNSEKAIEFTENFSKWFDERAWAASAELAKEKGAFPLFKESILNKDIPVRNSSVTTIAPTGTISLIADCSSGIEPFFSIVWSRSILWQKDGPTVKLLETPRPLKDLLPREKAQDILQSIFDAPDKTKETLAKYKIDAQLFPTAHEITPDYHVKMQAAWQKHISNSISKTINLPKDATANDVYNVYVLAWELGCKSITIYRDGSKSQQVLETKSIESKALEKPKKRPKTTDGKTEKLKTGHGNLYITVNFDEKKQPIEVFASLGKAGSCDPAYIEAIGRLASLSLRSGIDAKEIINQLHSITCHPVWDDGVQVKSASDAIALAMNHIIYGEELKNGNNNNSAACIECGSTMIIQEGCEVCSGCGWNRCGG